MYLYQCFCSSIPWCNMDALYCYSLHGVVILHSLISSLNATFWSSDECYWWHGRPLIIFINTFGVPLKLSMLAVKNLCSSHPAEYEKCRCVMRSWMIEIGIVIMRKLVVRPLTIIAFWHPIGEGKRSQMWMEDCSMTREWITNKLTLSWHRIAKPVLQNEL